MTAAGRRPPLHKDTRVRHYAALAAAALGVAACATPADPTPTVTSPPAATATTINPARIDRARTELPPGYEVTDLADRPTPVRLWGFSPGWTADPGRCGPLAAPAFDAASLHGWSASGDGGIVYTFAAAGAVPPDRALIGECASWTLVSGRATGTVTSLDPPQVVGAVTVGLGTAVLNTVEGGTETRSRADTFLAFADGHVVVVAVITDPGAALPPLEAGFAADLLTKTVAALRG